MDIVIATPGRLVDHILKTPGFSLDDLRFLVIDEADRAADWLEYLPEPHYRAPELTLFNKRHRLELIDFFSFSASCSQFYILFLKHEVRNLLYFCTAKFRHKSYYSVQPYRKIQKS